MLSLYKNTELALSIGILKIKIFNLFVIQVTILLLHIIFTNGCLNIFQEIYTLIEQFVQFSICLMLNY